jgi:hypothetical protein
LYALLGTEALLLRQESVRKNFFNKLKSLPIVRLSNGSYSVGRKCYFPSENVQHDEILPRVAFGVYNSGKSNTQQTEAKKLLEEIGVREVGEREQVQAILKQHYSSQPQTFSDTTYLTHLKRFISLSENESNIASLFANYHVFRSADGRWVKPDQLYLDSPYTESGLMAYYRALGNNARRVPLHSSYENLRLPVKGLLKFLETIGVEVKLSVEKTTCIDNPAFDYLVSQAQGRWSPSGVNEDYTIRDLDKLLNKADEELSRLVWKTVCQLKNSDWLMASYRNSQYQEMRTAPSRLAYILRHTAWIPQTNGIFVRPSSASPQLLPSGFPYDPGYEWLKVIRFAEDERVNSKKQLEQQSLAEELGFQDAETLERAKQFAAIPRETQERILATFLREQTELPQNEPKNPERRADRIAGEAGDAPERITEERLRSISVGREQVKVKAAEYLQQQYTNHDGEMICQICRSILPFKLADGTYYFETIELLKELEKRHYQNYLSLCPNHAAMFMHANDSAESIKQVFSDIEGNEIDLVLAQKDHNVYFTKTHIADLKIVIEADRTGQQSQDEVVDLSVGNGSAVQPDSLTQESEGNDLNVNKHEIALKDLHLSDKESDESTSHAMAETPRHENTATSHSRLVTAILPERNIRITFKSGNETIWQSRVYRSKNTFEKIIAFARTQARGAGVSMPVNVRTIVEVTNDGRTFAEVQEIDKQGN